MRSKLFISVAAIVLLAGTADARILINGFEHEKEWRGATTLYAGPEGKVEALRDREFLYLRLTRPEHPLSGADLYIGHGSTRSHMLHVSTAISENDKIAGQATYDYGVWGQNRDWTVNVTNNWIREGKMVIVNPDAHEYQISLKKFASANTRLMFVAKRPETRIPLGADPATTARWLPLNVAAVPLIRD